MRLIPLLAISTLALAASVAACGDDETTSTSSQGGSGAGSTTTAQGGSTTSQGGSVTSQGGSSAQGGSAQGGSAQGGGAQGGSGGGCTVYGDCQSNADCPAMGSECVPLTPCGFHVCTEPVREATMCTTPGDQCCDAMPCANGTCFASPFGTSCGGFPPPKMNVCAEDECQTTAECPASQICAPAGTFGYPTNTCVRVGCVENSDCTAKANGRCAPVQPACCNAENTQACVYDDGCRSNADCPAGHCVVENGASICAPGPSNCPP